MATVDAARDDDVLKVAASTPAGTLASAIAHAVYDGTPVTMRAVGAGAVNQAIKALAIAQSYVAPRGIILSCRPGFTEVTMPDGKVMSGIIIRVFTG
jgi:stage V sporulation protein S